MRILIVSEKPSLGKHLLARMAENGMASGHEVYNISMPSIAALQMSFRYPHGAAYRDFPRVAEPDYKEFSPIPAGAELEFTSPFAFRSIEADSLRKYGNRVDDELVASIIRHVDKAVFAFDPCATGQHGSLRVHEWFRGKNPYAETVWTGPILSFHDDALDAMLTNEGTIETALRFAKPSVIKRHFDYNYNLNSLVVIQRVFDRCGFPKSDIVPGKYSLQLLYHMAKPDYRPQSDGPLIDTMARRWKGTGKFVPEESGHFDGVGSPASRYAIIELLHRNGLVARAGRSIHVTHKGRRFLSALHPDCEDADLPFRIARWQGMEDEGQAKAEIGRYIRTFFGKQMRFFDKQPATRIAA
jgi:hypothetical protein